VYACVGSMQAIPLIFTLDTSTTYRYLYNHVLQKGLLRVGAQGGSGLTLSFKMVLQTKEGSSKLVGRPISIKQPHLGL
jgi:hypothetical protein